MNHIPTLAAVMTPFPLSAEIDDTLRRARDVMTEHEIRHLPVVRDHVLLGFLTDRDITRALDPDLGLPSNDELFVRDVYIPDPYVVDDHSPLDDVLEHVAIHHLWCALVTTHGRLSGIFTTTDACWIYCEHLRRIFPRPAWTDVA